MAKPDFQTTLTCEAPSFQKAKDTLRFSISNRRWVYENDVRHWQIELFEECFENIKNEIVFFFDRIEVGNYKLITLTAKT